MIGIAVSGKAGAGKSTFAKSLIRVCESCELPAEKIAFADELKREVFELHGITKEMVGGREALIRYGEERRRADPDHWIRPVAERVRFAQVCGILPVIDDMRFLREYEWALSVHLTLVRLVASPLWRRAKLISQGLDAELPASSLDGETQLDGLRHDHSVRNGVHVNLEVEAVKMLQATDTKTLS
ncbi:MAG: hypothetical protein H0U53_10945 [Actinobacteria bacterium]|nr:hypothetical protein [Actinomycetota bacterium]